MLRAGLAVIIAAHFYPHIYLLAMTKAQQPARAAKAANGGRNTPCRTCCYHSPHAPIYAPNFWLQQRLNSLRALQRQQ